MNNIFKFELKVGLKSAIIWTITAVFIMIIFNQMYPSFKEQAASFEQLLNSYPPELIKGLGLDVNNFATEIGFYSFSCIYGAIIFSIYGASLGIRQFSNEKKKHIYEFLLTKPVTRENIFGAKIFSGLILIFFSFIIYNFTTLIFIPTYSTINSIVNLISINIIILLMMLFFYFIGVMIAIILPKVKVTTGLSIPLVIGFYFVSILKSLLDISELKYLSPFSMFVTNEVLTNGLEKTMVIYICVLYLVFVLIGFYLFKKQDVR